MNRSCHDVRVISDHWLKFFTCTYICITCISQLTGNPSTDIGLYLFQMTKQEEPAQFIAYTLHRILGYVSKF